MGAKETRCLGATLEHLHFGATFTLGATLEHFGATLTLAHTCTLDVEKKKDNAWKTMRIICTHTAQSQRRRAEKQCNPSHRDWPEIHSYWRSWAPSSKGISREILSFWSLAKK